MATVTTPVKIWGNELLSVADINQYLGQNIQALLDGRVLRIADVPLTASASNITFSSIPAVYRNLFIKYYLRADNAGVTNVPLNIQFNGDAGAHYDSYQLTTNGAGTAAFGVTEILGGTSAEIGALPAANAASGEFAGGRIEIPNYQSTAGVKPATNRGGLKIGTSTGQLFLVESAAWWRTVAAVNSITIFPPSGNFVAGSSAQLYGEL